MSLYIVCSPTENLAGDAVIGRLTQVKGNITIKRLGVGEAAAGKAGDTVSIGDTLQTGKDSYAQLTFPDNSFVNLSTDTALRVNQYNYSIESKRRKALINVLKGKGRFLSHSPMEGDSAFIVETDSALVTTNVADFVITVSPIETEVAVLNGRVRVKNISMLTVEEISLTINQKTVVREKTPPAKPVIITPEQRKEYLKDTLALRRS